MRATSVAGSRPTTLAATRSLPSAIRTHTLSAPSTTWLLVTIRPSLEMKNPLPAPARFCGRPVFGPGKPGPKKNSNGSMSPWKRRISWGLTTSSV